MNKQEEGYCDKCKFRKEEYETHPCDFRDFGDFYNMCFNYTPKDFAEVNNITFATNVTV